MYTTGNTILYFYFKALWRDNLKKALTYMALKSKH